MERKSVHVSPHRLDGRGGKVWWKFENVTIFPMGKKVKEWKFIFGVYQVMDNLHTSIVKLLCTCIHIPVLQREMWFVDCSYIHAYIHTSAETNSDICYLNSCFLNDQIPNNLCTHRDACIGSMHARKHTCMHTYAHTHKVVVAGDMHNLQWTFFSQIISKYSLTELLKGLRVDLLELALLYNWDTWNIKWGPIT